MKKFKKTIIFPTVVLPLFITALFLPMIVEQSITQVETTVVSLAEYTEDIYVSGSVEELSKKDIIAELPIVPEKINFKVGDYVNANDIIAEIDTVATQAALFNLAELSEIIPQEYMSVIGKINIDQNIVEQYIPTVISAPASGTITSMSLVEGAMSTPKSSVVTISRTEELKIRITVNEADADKVSVGDTVVFKANATSDKKYSGKIERIFPTAAKTLVGTSQSTVVNMYVSITSEHSRLKPGYTVNGVIKQPSQVALATLPYEAILQDENNNEYVYLVNGSKLERCNVKTGKELGNGVEIISPNLNDKRVVSNASDVKSPDALIKIKNN